MYIPVYTRTYAYILVQSVMYALEKCKQDWNPQSCAYCSQNLSTHYGGTDLNDGMLATLF